MNRNLHTLAAAAALAFGLSHARAALADVTVTPSAAVDALATDNAGQRAPGQAPRGDAITTLQAGGDVLWSHPTWAVKMQALGEYERYLSAAVKNTYAAGGLDGRWRPDERTTVRSNLKASYAPDRYDPRVPYRLAAAAPAAADLPLFVRATTTRVSETAQAERWITERFRGRLIGDWSTTRYSNREAIGPEPGAIPAKFLQGHSAGRVEADALQQMTETFALGGFGAGSRGDYEAGPSVYTEEAGALAEWDVTERLEFHAKAGAQVAQVPGPHGEPSHVGWMGEASLKRLWQRGSIEAIAHDGVSVTTSAIPAAQEQSGRLVGTFLPFELVETQAYAGITRERSMYEVYRAVGTATIWSAGGSVGWRFREHWTARLGFDHTQQDARGLVEIPYRANTVFLGFSFTGLSFGDPPAYP